MINRLKFRVRLPNYVDFILILALLCTCSSQGAEYNGYPVPRLNYVEHRLDNGLRIIVVENHHAPVYSLAVAYGVGSSNESPQQVGIAHLLEHLMFKGSEHVGSGEHSYLVTSLGGTANATTGVDRTIYYQTLPSNQLALGMFLEADRMKMLQVTTVGLENQRRTVLEERRQALDNRPYGRTLEALASLVYTTHPYRHSIIGSSEDINNISLTAVKEFHASFYVPNNAVLVVVGDVEHRSVVNLAKMYFGSIPSKRSPKLLFREPQPTKERVLRITDALARVARVDIAYTVAPGDTADGARASIATSVLCNGEMSRLHQSLVNTKRVATAVTCFLDERRYLSTIRVIATVRPEHTVEAVVSALDDELRQVHTNGITPTEVERVRRRLLYSALQARDSSLTLAQLLADYTVVYNNPGLINTGLKKLLNVSQADVAQCIRKYMVPSCRSVVYTLPGRVQ